MRTSRGRDILRRVHERVLLSLHIHDRIVARRRAAWSQEQTRRKAGTQNLRSWAAKIAGVPATPGDLSPPLPSGDLEWPTALPPIGPSLPPPLADFTGEAYDSHSFL